MKKVLFLDRDGVILKEPPVDYQIDTFEKFELMPYVITSLQKIVLGCDYELVMITNQDGLGTESFPYAHFQGPHELMLRTMKSEGIHFSEVHIDRSFEKENLPTRKPGTALLTHFMNGGYDMRQSLVIGDRYSDMKLAENLGCKGILLGISADKSQDKYYSSALDEDTIVLKTNSWKTITDYLLSKDRYVSHRRVTKETSIAIDLNLDGNGISQISTGIAFFDHMLEQLSRHGRIDLNIEVRGDLEVDEHHTIEDTALALGETFNLALQNKRGLERYGYALPMDESEAHVSLDFGGRPWLVWDASFEREKIGEMPTEMFYHFFKSFSDAARCNLNIKVTGSNEHHKIEAIFKAWARAIKMAIKRDINSQQLPSTKGSL